MSVWWALFLIGAALSLYSIIGALFDLRTAAWKMYAVVGLIGLVLMWIPILTGNLS